MTKESQPSDAFQPGRYIMDEVDEKRNPSPRLSAYLIEARDRWQGWTGRRGLGDTEHRSSGRRTFETGWDVLESEPSTSSVVDTLQPNVKVAC